MDQKNLNVRRFYSEQTTFRSPVVSPVPVKRTAKLSMDVVKEVCDVASEIDDLRRTAGSLSPTNLMKHKLRSQLGDADSPGEWSLDSGLSTAANSNTESPERISPQKNILLQNEIYLDVNFNQDVPSRSSNPIVNDKFFKHYSVISSPHERSLISNPLAKYC